MKKLLQNLWNRIKDLHRDARGFVLMSTLAIFLFLFVLCASIYAVGETIHQRIKLQNACDAAAYSAACVQADGLSRMATVNRAMAWTYVQMTNRQMDYITYRWLRLTCKRFNEDKENARKYCEQLPMAFNPNRGWWAIAEIAVTAVISMMFQAKCNDWHEKDGDYQGTRRGWWCSNVKGSTQSTITFNGQPLIPSTIPIDSSIFKNILDGFGRVFDNNFPSNKPEDWAYRLGILIDSDKKNILALNNVLSTINKQMELSMRVTAENTLKNMLIDGRLGTVKNALKDYYISISIPHATNPYTEDYTTPAKSFFSPLHNTEPEESLFLNMGNYKTPLAKHFNSWIPGKKAYGVDQWFIRGAGLYKDSREDKDKNIHPCFLAQETETNKGGPAYRGRTSGHVNDKVILTGTIRKEEGLGIQRVYKDANINDTKAGVFNHRIDRGNHIFKWDFLTPSLPNNTLFEKLASNVFSIINTYISHKIDISPSCRNDLKSTPIGMCKKITTTTTSLYAEYEWATSKWFCLQRNAEDFIICMFINKKRAYCGWQEKSIRGIDMKGWGHWQVPKWFCGAKPKYLGSNYGAPAWLLKYLPPLDAEQISGNKHGYMNNVFDLGSNGFLKPLKGLIRSTSYSRDEYESCAIFPDGSWDIGVIKENSGREGPGNELYAAPLRGHARIYGDDKEIFDNRYVGAICKPWVLNERFFSGEGTIYVGAAMKHVNPFVRLFSMLGDNVTQENNDKTIFSAFNVPQRKYGKKAQFYYMWTMSAARAGVRHTRREGHYDQPRKYQVVYDPTSDPENLFYNGTPLVYSPEDKTWHSVTNGQVMNWDDPNNPNALTRTNLEKQSHAAIWDGCPCGVSSMQLRWNWNLCETDWDATLLPVRFSGAKALLFHSIEHKNGEKIEKSYNTVDKTARETYIYQSPEFQRVARLKWNKDKYDAKSLGCGENWVWEDPDFITFGHPYLVGIWKPAADQIYLPIPGAATPSTRVSLNLDGKIPEGKDAKKVNLYYLWRGKWL